jgi:hypothetical protein
VDHLEPAVATILALWLVVDASMLVAELLRAQGRARLSDDRLDLFISEHVLSEVHHELPRRARRFASRRGVPPGEMVDLVQACFNAVDSNVATSRRRRTHLMRTSHDVGASAIRPTGRPWRRRWRSAPPCGPMSLTFSELGGDVDHEHRPGMAEAAAIETNSVTNPFLLANPEGCRSAWSTLRRRTMFGAVIRACPSTSVVVLVSGGPLKGYEDGL